MRKLALLIVATLLGLGVPIASAVPVSAAASDDGLSLQVSPSPLTETVKPGTNTSLELHIRNTGTVKQGLRIDLRNFSIAELSGQVNLSTKAPTDVEKFVSFSDPTFSIEAGQIFTQHVSINTPANAGFSYSFAMVISQQNPPKAEKGKTAIHGSVAVFTLLTVDRPGATRKLELTQLAISKHVYEFLPATVTLKFKNTGNTLVQPKGTLYIQRHSKDETPLAAIPINDTDGSILPGTSRVLTSKWSDGLPHYNTVTQPGKTPETKLSWSGGDISKIRFGRYTAKVVAVYDDGDRDVPLNAEVTFWVIPWRIIGVLLFIFLLAFVGIFVSIKKSTKVLIAKKKKHAAHKKDTTDKE